jgi:hypothetical protein
VESDLSAFHRVDDALALSPQRFIDLALRLPWYRGVVRGRAEQEQRESPSAAPASRPATARTTSSRDAPRTVSSDAATLKTDPGLGGMFDIVKAPPKE